MNENESPTPKPTEHERAPMKRSMKKMRERFSDRREMRPNKASGWREMIGIDLAALNKDISALSLSVWHRRGVFVISTLEMAEAPDGGKDVIPQWHVSISTRLGGVVRRSTDQECRQVAACFGVAGAEEDNHHPGIARHYWMPMDPKRRVDCECKVTETVVTDPDGYRWSNSTDPADCRGCELEATLAREAIDRPCPIHKPAAAP